MKSPAILAFMAAFALSSAAAAQDDAAIETVGDRPTFSAAAAVVAAGHGQLELGGEFATADGASRLVFPVLARVGIAEAFELRAGLPSFVFPLGGDADAELGALQLGGKIAGDATDSLSLGVLPYADIAAGNGQETFARSTFGFFLLWGFAFSDLFGIGGNLGASVGPGSSDEAGPRELFYAASLTASVAAGPMGITAEGFTVLGQYADATVGGSLSAGYPLLDNLVVDVYGGSSAQAGVANIFAGAGLTVSR